MFNVFDFNLDAACLVQSPKNIAKGKIRKGKGVKCGDKHFESVTSCADFYRINTSTVHKSLTHKEPTPSGLLFEYVTESCL